MRQKYHKGDTVRLIKKFPPDMDHFPGEGKLATVVGSFRDMYPSHSDSSTRNTYALKVPGYGENAWYDEEMMLPIRIGKPCPHCKGKGRVYDR